MRYCRKVSASHVPGAENPLAESPFQRKSSPPLLLHQPPLPYVTQQQISDVFDQEAEGRRRLTVCFTGHRSIPSNIQPLLTKRLDETLRTLYRHGYRDFLCGGALGFDMLAAQRVLQLTKACPDAHLCMAIPCSTQSAHWSPSDCQSYEQLLYSAHETQVLSRDYYEGCMLTRNRYMVDRSAFCVCYLTHHHGGTLYTAHYALKEHLPLLNLAIEADYQAFLKKWRDS